MREKVPLSVAPSQVRELKRMDYLHRTYLAVGRTFTGA